MNKKDFLEKKIQISSLTIKRTFGKFFRIIYLLLLQIAMEVKQNARHFDIYHKV